MKTQRDQFVRHLEGFFVHFFDFFHGRGLERFGHWRLPGRLPGVNFRARAHRHDMSCRGDLMNINDGWGHDKTRFLPQGMARRSCQWIRLSGE